MRSMYAGDVKQHTVTSFLDGSVPQDQRGKGRILL